MKRTLWAVLLSVFLAFVMVLPVHASSGNQNTDTDTEKDVKTLSTKGVFSYIQGGHLFSFLEIEDGLDVDNVLVNAAGDNLQYKDNGKLVKLADSDVTVHYLFVIDNSGSMSGYRNRISDYLSAIAEHSDLKVTYTIATFGERFDIVKEKMTDVETAKEALKSVSFNENYTDPYTAIKSADTYLDGFAKSGRDIVSVVLITDGEPCLKDPSKEENFSSMTKKVIGEFTDVVYSTLSLASWTDVAKKTLTGGNGFDQEIRANSEAGQRGSEIADYFDKLYCAEFALTKAPDKDFDYNVQISFAKDTNGNDVNVENASFTGIHPGKVGEEAPVDEAPTTESPKDEQPSAENPSENPSEIESMEGSSEPTSENENEQKKGFLDYFEQYRLFVIIGAVVLLLLLIAIVILIVVITTIVKKKKAKKTAKKKGAREPSLSADAVPDTIGATVAAASYEAAGPVGYEPTVAPISPTGEPGTVFLRIEVYNGHCANTSDTFSLSNALVIGSAPQCDVIFADPDVSPVNTKIRLIDGQVYIEDQGTVNGTYLEGMRIPGRNRLRSGDIISIGSVEFAFKF